MLAYPKLAKVLDGAEQFADLVEASGVVVLPAHVIVAVKDESDNRVLEAAVEGAADYIVSGDEHLLGLGSFQRIPIVTPAQFISAGFDY